MGYLDRLKNLKSVGQASVESVETPGGEGLDTLGTTPSGPFQNFEGGTARGRRGGLDTLDTAAPGPFQNFEGSRRWWRLAFADGGGWPTYRGPADPAALRRDVEAVFRRELVGAVPLEETPELRRAREAVDGSLPADDLGTADTAVGAALAQARQVAEGVIPAHWTGTAVCRRCGPVPAPPGAPAHLLGCWWCRRRAAGLPVPRPLAAPAGDGADGDAGPGADGVEAAPLALVACAGCAHFRADPLNPRQGIGTCAAEAAAARQPVDRGRWHGPVLSPLYPAVPRECQDFRPIPGGAA